MHKVIPTRFIMAENRTYKLSGFIIELMQPFYIAKAFTYKSEDEYLSNLANSNKWQVTVPGYQILIRFEGSLNDERRLLISDSPAERHSQIMNMLKDMAEFYSVEKIGLHLGYYKKFLIKSNMPIMEKRF